ncbi:hypothetical protein [Kaistia adipata]|uniref:hypothetical protein n=1 Tax=Kaistia adipata TaxID=166954 RepID=UPI00048B97A3|nr:hypothetical protein [Kaistia adipata]
MSTARARAAAYIDATTAAGHSMSLHLGFWPDGAPGFLTAFHTGPKFEPPATTAALADTFDRDRKADRKALKAELIRRGMVQ